jgi:hypothetical protein
MIGLVLAAGAYGLLFFKFIRQRFPDLQIILETIVSCGASRSVELIHA